MKLSALLKVHTKATANETLEFFCPVHYVTHYNVLSYRLETRQRINGQASIRHYSVRTNSAGKTMCGTSGRNDALRVELLVKTIILSNDASHL